MAGNFRSSGGSATPPSTLGNDDTLYLNTQQPQQFKAYQIPNFQKCLYTLQIRFPDNTGNSNNLLDSYTFPISPESVRKEFNALTNFYDVAGDVTNLGVQRIVDVYGHTPAVFVIEGTTGWQLHKMDGFRYTGLQSIARIESLLSVYAEVNQQQINNGDPNLYQLWFLDFFRNDFWQVFPIGPQGVRQSVARPLYVNYSFRFVGVRRLDIAEPAAPDAISNLLSTSAAQASTVYNQFVSNYNAAYGLVTAPAK